MNAFGQLRRKHYASSRTAGTPRSLLDSLIGSDLVEEMRVTITFDDPRYGAAVRVLRAMHDYWKLDPGRCAVRWIEDTDGRVVIFTTGEYRDRIMAAIHGNMQPTERFERRELSEPPERSADGERTTGC